MIFLMVYKARLGLYIHIYISLSSNNINMMHMPIECL